MKRGRKDQLTGGSGDVNPQVLTISVAQSAANTGTAIAINLPIPRYPTTQNKNLVIEALGVQYFHLNREVTALPATSVGDCITLTTRPNAPGTIQEQLSDPRTISEFYVFNSHVGGVAAQDIELQSMAWDDLTDEAGHGILIATDVLYVALQSFNRGLPMLAVVKLLYRWKEVGLSEYIGIVQSQQ